jgi:hypothetical protein
MERDFEQFVDEPPPEHLSRVIMTQNQARALALAWQLGVGAPTLLEGALIAMQRKLQPAPPLPPGKALEHKEQLRDLDCAIAIAAAVRAQWDVSYANEYMTRNVALMMVNVWVVEYKTSMEQGALSNLVWGLKLPPYDAENFDKVVTADEKIKKKTDEETLMSATMARVRELWHVPGHSHVLHAANGALSCSAEATTKSDDSDAPAALSSSIHSVAAPPGGGSPSVAQLKEKFNALTPELMKVALDAAAAAAPSLLPAV